MIKLLLDGNTPPSVFGNVSDTEVLTLAEAYFPNATPLLQLLLKRYERLLEVAGDQEIATNTKQLSDEEEEEGDPTEVVTASCPSCGNQLIVQETAGS